MVIMVAAFVIAKKVGRELNVTYQRTNAKFPVVTIMDGVLMVIVIANVDGRDRFVINVSRNFNYAFSFVPCVKISLNKCNKTHSYTYI